MKFRTRLKNLFPFLKWGKNQTKESLHADMMAGLTGAAIVLPQGVAFAAIAGMPPEYGLYTSMVPAIIAALFGSSWHLVSGPTTAASIVMFSSLSVLAVPGSEQYIALAITLAFMVGVIQLVMGLVRLGTLVNFISHSVIVGFTAGAACLIAAKQAKTFFGIDLHDSEHLSLDISYLFTHWDSLHPLASAVALATLTVGVIALKINPKFPGMIVALLIGSTFAVLLNLTFGEEFTGIQMVGALPRQLPPLSTPIFSLHVLRDLAPLALAMTLFALTEAVSISRSISIKSGQPISGSQEFIGQGLSNIAGSFFSAYVATGSFNRSGANYDAGARSPFAAAFAGVILIVIVLAVAPLTSYLPKAAVAGLLILVAWRIINFSQIKKILRADPNEAAVLIVTFLSTIFLKLEFAILLGVILSLMIFLRRTSRPRLLPRVPDPDSRNRKFVVGLTRPECPQLKMLRLEDSLYFGSVSHVGELLRRYREHYPEQKHLLILTKGINQVDIAGAELLVNEARSRRKMGGRLYLYRLKDRAAKVMERGGYNEEIGEENIFDSKSEAISEIFDRLDKNICAKCTNRIFLECGSPDPSSRRKQLEDSDQTDTSSDPDAPVPT